ncbi:hypothetical protein ES708_11496 [subsurface metagenome]
MKNKRLVTLIGSVCLVLVLAALPFMVACPAPAPPEEVSPKIGILYSKTGIYSFMGPDELPIYGGLRRCFASTLDHGGRG